MARVLLKDLSKRFDDTAVVDSINLEIADEEFVVLVGPSGCGKSTTLRMIAGLEEPTDGEVWIGNRDVTDLAVKDRNIAMVFQNYALYPHMNVYDNMAFGLKMRGASRAEVDRSVRRSAEILGITPLLGRRPRQLSGGQRQRVALGRAIVRKPDVFLLDEPLSNLDAKLRVQMRSEIVKLRHRLRATMVYVTHDQVEAMSMGDRIVVMSDGEIQQVGPPMEVYGAPVNTFVAGFVGERSMNFLNGLMQRAGDELRVKLGAATVPLPERFRSLSVRDGAPVTVGIRPEHVRIAEGEGGDTVRATVEVAEPLGSSLVLDLSADIGPFVAEVDPERSLRAGDRLLVRFDPHRLHVFDPVSGKSLSAGYAGSGRPRLESVA